VSHPRIYACDLSVFPTSPAANPTLTLAALAVRLADHLDSVLDGVSAPVGNGTPNDED
jgi:choline dehydrogenase-like flavoprotein